MHGALHAVRTIVVLASALVLAHIAAAATKAELDREVQRFSVDCATNELYEGLFDCQCLTDEYRQGVRAANSTHRRKAIMRDLKLLAKCPATKPSVLAWFKRDCAASSGHPERIDFCDCTAEHSSTAFLASPPTSKPELERLKRTSMRACGMVDGPPLSEKLNPFK